MSNDQTPDKANEIVQFWRDAGPAKWFAKNPAFDQVFRERFLHDHMAAARREYEDWLKTPDGSLALIILLDQFPRNATDRSWCRNHTGWISAAGLARPWRPCLPKPATPWRFTTRSFATPPKCLSKATISLRVPR